MWRLQNFCSLCTLNFLRLMPIRFMCIPCMCQSANWREQLLEKNDSVQGCESMGKYYTHLSLVFWPFNSVTERIKLSFNYTESTKLLLPWWRTRNWSFSLEQPDLTICSNQNKCCFKQLWSIYLLLSSYPYITVVCSFQNSNYRNNIEQ